MRLEPAHPVDVDTVVDRVNDLIRVQYDVLDAYRAAISRIEAPFVAPQLDEYLRSHSRHILELSHCVESLGSRAQFHGDAKRVLEKGRVMLAKVAGDRAILKAVVASEETSIRAYRDVLTCDACMAVPMIRATIERAVADEEVHLAWLERAIDRLA